MWKIEMFGDDSTVSSLSRTFRKKKENIDRTEQNSKGLQRWGGHGVRDEIMSPASDISSACPSLLFLESLTWSSEDQDTENAWIIPLLGEGVRSDVEIRSREASTEDPVTGPGSSESEAASSADAKNPRHTGSPASALQESADDIGRTRNSRGKRSRTGGFVWTRGLGLRREMKMKIWIIGKIL